MGGNRRGKTGTRSPAAERKRRILLSVPNLITVMPSFETLFFKTQKEMIPISFTQMAGTALQFPSGHMPNACIQCRRTKAPGFHDRGQNFVTDFINRDGELIRTPTTLRKYANAKESIADGLLRLTVVENRLSLDLFIFRAIEKWKKKENKAITKQRKFNQSSTQNVGTD